MENWCITLVHIFLHLGKIDGALLVMDGQLSFLFVTLTCLKLSPILSEQKSHMWCKKSITYIIGCGYFFASKCCNWVRKKRLVIVKMERGNVKTHKETARENVWIPRNKVKEYYETESKINRNNLGHCHKSYFEYQGQEYPANSINIKVQMW